MSFLRLALSLSLFCSAIWLIAESQDPIRLSSKPGIYRDSVLLSVESDPAYTVRYRFRPGNDKFISFNQALSLTSLPGETRVYRLTLQINKNDREIERRDLDYIIDNTPPLSPEPLIAPITYYRPTQIAFSLNPRDSDARIPCSIRGSDGTSLEISDGKSFELPGKSGLSIQYAITVFAEDSVHNLSPARTWNYIIDRRQERELTSLPVLSPIEGRFQNPQYLYVDNQAFEKIRYTTDGSDPRNGKDYQAGVLLEVSGRVDLRVWGKTFSGKELEKRISYESSLERLAELESGTIDQAKILQFNQETMHYSVGDRMATSQDAVLGSPLRIAPQPGALRGLGLNLLRARDQAQFRYYLLLDGRQPAKPEIWIRTKNPLGGLKTIAAGEAVNEFLEITVQGNPGSRTWYRLDGQTPDKNDGLSIIAPNAFRIDRADLQKFADRNGVCTLTFQSRQGENTWGPVNQVPVQVHPQLALPAISLAQGGDQQSRISWGDWPGTIWYTVNSEYHDTATAGPFALPTNPKIELPFGAQGNFSYQFFGIGPDGMFAQGQAKLNAKISLVPPDEPIITRLADGKIRITGSNAIFYRISSEQETAPSITKDFQAYANPLELKPLAGDNLSYWVEAQARDGGGNQSSTARAGPFIFHTRPAKPIHVVGGETEIFRNQNNFKLQLEAPERGMRYFYSLGMPGSVSDPDRNSPSVDSEIPVQRKEESVTLELRVRGISSIDPRLIGPVAKFTLIIDTRLPSVPKISGVEAGKAYRTPLNIEISADADSQISYRLRKLGDADEPAFIDYTQAIHIDAPPESSTDWELMVKTRNRAGSESGLAKPLLFRVKTITPSLGLPVFTTADAAIVSADDQKRVFAHSDIGLQLTPQAGTTIRYELGQDQNRIRVPDLQSPVYERRIIVKGEAKANTAWFFRYRVFDEAGNLSPPSAVYTLRINQIPPPIPAQPRISRQGNAGDLSWIVNPDIAVQYFISPSEISDKSLQFQTYGGEKIQWSLSAGQAKVWIYYRALDRAGNVSETAIMTISQNIQPSQLPTIVGVASGGLYKDPILIRVSNLVPGAEIRYELGTGDQGPPEVGPQSPVFGEQLEIGPIKGETVKYHLALRVFIDGTEASEPLLYDFIIDRTPPLAPKIANLPTVAWLAKTSSVRLSGDDGDSIYYSMAAETLAESDSQMPLSSVQLDDLNARASFQPVRGDISLAADPNGVVRYIISAYSLDAAGNRSANLSVWQIFVDTQSVFVSDASLDPSGDNQLETGTRTEPFHDLAKAIDFAKRSGKRTLFVSTGKFIINSLIPISGDLVIRGGFAPDTWLPKANAATILYPRPGFSDNALLDVKDAKLRLQGIYLIDAGLALKSLIQQTKGTVSIIECNLAITLSAAAIRSEFGTLSVAESSLSANDPLESRLIAGNSLTCHLNNVILENSDLPPVLSKNINRSRIILLDLANSDLDANQIKFMPRHALYSTAIRQIGGTSSLQNCDISTGSGSQSALGIDAAASAKVTLSNSSLKSERKANTAVLVHLDKSDYAMYGGSLWLEAGLGAYGIWGSQGGVIIDGSEIKAVQSKDFLTLVSLESCKLQMVNNRISGAETPDFRLAVLRGGTSSWKANICKISAGQTMPGTGLFSIQAGGNHEFSENNLSGNDLATLFFVDSADSKVTVRNNILEHWRFLLQETPKSLIRQSDTDRGVSTIQELEQIDRQGSLFAGNKVRQGL